MSYWNRTSDIKLSSEDTCLLPQNEEALNYGEFLYQMSLLETSIYETANTFAKALNEAVDDTDQKKAHESTRDKFKEIGKKIVETFKRLINTIYNAMDEYITGKKAWILANKGKILSSVANDDMETITYSNLLTPQFVFTQFTHEVKKGRVEEADAEEIKKGLIGEKKTFKLNHFNGAQEALIRKIDEAYSEIKKYRRDALEQSFLNVPSDISPEELEELNISVKNGGKNAKTVTGVLTLYINECVRILKMIMDNPVVKDKKEDE